MENFLRDNVGTFDFGLPPPTNIIDPKHPLFGWQPPSTRSSIPHDPFFSPNNRYQPTKIELIDPNIPSIQVNTPISQNTQPILTQPLVHTTPQPTSVPSVSTFSIPIPALQYTPFSLSNIAFSLPSQNTSNPFTSSINIQPTSQYTTRMPPLGLNTSSLIPPNITINSFVTSQSTLASFPLGPWSFGKTREPTSSIPFIHPCPYLSHIHPFLLKSIHYHPLPTTFLCHS